MVEGEFGAVGELQLTISNRRELGWIIVFIVGLLLLCFAYDNLFVIPTLMCATPTVTGIG